MSDKSLLVPSNQRNGDALDAKRGIALARCREDLAQGLIVLLLGYNQAISRNLAASAAEIPRQFTGGDARVRP